MKKTALFIASIVLSTSALTVTALAATALAGCDSKVPQVDASTSPAATSSQASNTPTTGDSSIASKEASAPAPAPADSSAKSGAAGTKPLEKSEIAVLETNLGTIKIKFRSDLAPETVKNFIKLAKSGFYDGTKFHRVIPGFMIQGGDPKSKGDNRAEMGTGDPGYKIKAEFNDLSHKRGVISMARAQDPDSAGSQFFIVVKDSTFLDHQYTGFGEVIEGMDVADKIVALPRDSRDNPLPDHPAIIKHIKIIESPAS